jgi:hypothetical protein
MDSNPLKVPFGMTLFVGISVIVILLSIIYLITAKHLTMPWQRGEVEGFFGGIAVGAGSPNCLHTLNGAAEIVGRFEGSAAGVEEGNKDFAELQLILSKMACMKKDLMSPSGIVEATRYQPFATSHDREQVSETVARCFAKTIPARDLDISFDTWKERGLTLLARLCTAADLSEAESSKMEKLYISVWSDVYDVARSQCLSGAPQLAGHSTGSPRDPAPMTSADVQSLRDYEGYF